MLVDLIREFQGLGLPQGPAADLFERTLQALLAAEGPPPEPIPGISSAPRTAIARTPKGRPVFLCHTWTTYDWTCLLLDLPPVVMGRPVFIKNPNGGQGRVVTDYQSQKFQRRIVSACAALNLPAPPEPSCLTSLLAPDRFFLAWSPLRAAPPALNGDLDNYAKNIMDGLQRARIVPNDRTIAKIGFARALLPAADESLDAHLLTLLLRVRADNPKLNRRALAKLAGISQRACKRLLDLAPAHSSDSAAPGPLPAPITPPDPAEAPPQAQDSPLDSATPPAIPTPAPIASPLDSPFPAPQPLSRDQLRRLRQRQLRRPRSRPSRRPAATASAPLAPAALPPAPVIDALPDLPDSLTE